MPEPVSIITAVATALVWANRTKEFIESIKNAPDVVKHIADELATLRQPLQDIHSLIENATHLDPNTKAQLAKGLGPALQTCQRIAKDIEDALRPYVKPDREPRRNVWKRMLFTFNEDRITRLREELLTCKSSLTVAIGISSMLIHVKQAEQSQRIDDETQKASRGIKRLHKHFNIATSSVTDSELIPDEGELVAQSEVIKQWISGTETVIEEKELENDSARVTHDGISNEEIQADEVVDQTTEDDVQHRPLNTIREVKFHHREFHGHKDRVHSVAFSRDGTKIASGSYDKTVRLWDAATGRKLQALRGHTSYVLSVAFSLDGSMTASGSRDKSVRLWNTVTGKQLRQFSGHTHYVNSVAFSPDGTTMASASNDGSVIVWSITTGRLLKRLPGHSGGVCCIAFSTSGNTIVSGGFIDNAVRLWDVATGRQRRELQGHSGSVYCVAFSPDGTMIASGSSDSSVRLWETATETQLLELRGHSGGVCNVTFSANGDKILSGGFNDEMVRLWDVATGRQIWELPRHLSSVCCIAFSPDGSSMASGSYDPSVQLWDATTRRRL